MCFFHLIKMVMIREAIDNIQVILQLLLSSDQIQHTAKYRYVTCPLIKLFTGYKITQKHIVVRECIIAFNLHNRYTMFGPSCKLNRFKWTKNQEGFTTLLPDISFIIYFK